MKISDFEGDLVGNVFSFKPIVYKTAAGKDRIWQIYVRLVKNKSEGKANWDPIASDEIPIIDSYFTESVEPPAHAEYWTMTGEVNGKRTNQAPTYVTAKKNARTSFQQAMFEANSIYTKYLKRKGKVDSDDGLYFPMRASKGVPYKFDIYAQPKLNGNRCVAFNSNIMYTRDKKMYPESPTINRIRDELSTMKFDFYLDGELYKHGVPLQDITSMCRSGDADGVLEFHVFDCFDPAKPDLTFAQRLKLLEGLKYTKYVKLLDTVLLTDENAKEKYFKKCLKAGYEGIILRKPSGKYKISNIKTSTSSKDVIKIKPIDDEEFKVVDFTQGSKGRAVGSIVWICETAEGKRFNVVPKATAEEKKALYRDCLKNFSKYEGRMMKVQFAELTKSGIPKEARAIGFRDVA